MSVSIAVTCLRGGQCHPASYTAPRTHSITGGIDRQRGLYQNIDRDTHCLLHQELMRIQLILINVSLLNSFSLCMCTDVRWSSQSLSNRALPCVDTVLYLHVYRQCGLTSSRQRILRSQVTMAVPSHDTATTYRYWPTFSLILSPLSLCHHHCCYPFSDW